LIPHHRIRVGGFGEILLGKLEGENVVIKIPAYNNNEKARDLAIEFIEKEIEVLQSIHHEHLLKIIGYGSDPNVLKSALHQETCKRYICVEYCEKGNYIEYLISKPSIFLSQIVNQMIQIVSAMIYLHFVLEIAHRDLKTDNVLVDGNENIKVCDFGLSSRLTRDHQLMTLLASHRKEGVKFFIDPQYSGNEEEQFHRKYDVYAFGALLYHIFILRIEINLNSRMVFDQSVVIDPIVNEYIVPLIKGCIDDNHETRLNFIQIHKFLIDLEKEIVETSLDISLQFKNASTNFRI
jgi:non-specific serine/threonine protein kinase